MNFVFVLVARVIDQLITQDHFIISIMGSAQSERELLPQHVEPVKIGNDHADHNAQDKHEEMTKEPPAPELLPRQMGSHR